MTTFDFVSISADGIRPTDDPLVSVSTIVANLGSRPAVTVPMIAGEESDVTWIWDYLAEPADFFGMVTPSRDELRVACERFTTSATAAGSSHSLLAVTITLIEVEGLVQFVITGVPVSRFDPTPVRIAIGGDASWSAPGVTDPLWRRMAARTTSRGEVDQRRRWLKDNGFVDQVAPRGESLIGPPTLGALVFDRGDGLIGLDGPGPTGALWLMAQCGAIRAGIITGSTDVVDLEQVSSAWWISSSFEIHPVGEIGEAAYRVESALPANFLGRLT